MQDEDSEIRARLERDKGYWIDASILEDLEKGRACDYGQRTAAKMLRSRGDWIVHAESELERLRTVVEAWLKYSQRAERDIETLRAERDEARREICERVSTTRWQPQFPLMTKRQYAEERGWDCFKEKP